LIRCLQKKRITSTYGNPRAQWRIDAASGKSTRAAQFSFSGNLARSYVMMNLAQLCTLVEMLRKEAIGEPKMIAEKHAYEYQDHSAKVVAVLKLVRAAHGVSAMNLLCRSGLFIDFGAIVRCVYDCTEEVYFLLEEFPSNRDRPRVRSEARAVALP
jgi:hypothetical protein